MEPPLDRLQGAWTVVTLEVEGRAVPGGALHGAGITVTGDRFETTGMGAAYGGLVRIDESNLPHRIEIEYDQGPHAGRASLGIYRFDGDRWILCLGMADAPRPTDFSTTPGSGHALETLERAACEHAPAAAPAQLGATNAAAQPEDGSDYDDSDLEALAGEWRMVSCVRDGMELPPSMTAAGKRVVAGRDVRVTLGGQTILEATMRADALADPKRMDYTLASGATQLGIYALEGNTLSVCSGPVGGARPAEFASAPGEGRTYTVWRKA